MDRGTPAHPAAVVQSPTGGLVADTASPVDASRSAPPTPVSGDVRKCTKDDLRLSATNSGGGLGAVGAYLRFQNVGDASCALSGWPTLSGVRDDGTVVPATKSDAVLTFPAVTGHEIVVLTPNASAIAAFASGDTPSGTKPCGEYVKLDVAAPGIAALQSVGTFNAWYGRRLPACGPLEVTAVVDEARLEFILPYRP
jgi:hypothetical protein